MVGWVDLEALTSNLSPDDRVLSSRPADLDLPEDPDAVAATLRDYAERSPDSTPSVLLATAGSQASQAGEEDFARRTGSAALRPRRQLRRAAYRSPVPRADPLPAAARGGRVGGFVAHCRAAVDLGPSGTFCYERLAVLYEFRGDPDGAIEISRRAVEALTGAGDARSAGRFQGRLDRLSTKRAG